MRANGCGRRRYSRPRASSSLVVSSTRPALRSTPRWRLAVGRLSDSADAMSLDRCGFLRSSRITARRAGSPSAGNVSSRLGCTRLAVPHPVPEPPVVPFGVLGAVAAVGPVVVAVVVRRRGLDDLRPRRAGARAVRVGVVDDDPDGLRVRAAERARALARKRLRALRAAAGLADRNEPLAADELRG